MTVLVRDPYAVPGEYRKAQLHCHTTASDGRFSPRELLGMYKDAGYSFVFITDHNQVTRCDELNDGTFLALPGTEDTVSTMRPLGPHLLRLFVRESLRGGDAQRYIDRTEEGRGLCALAHPSWTGNLWSGSWPAQACLRLRGYHLVEICNPHSAPARDLRRWEAALRRPDAPPVWGIAVDDCHHRGQFNRAWVAVRVPEITAGALRSALRAGAFYATTGPGAEFAGRGPTITVGLEEHLPVRFVDAAGRVRLAVEEREAAYTAQGDEGFIRVEAGSGRRAVWSQPFVIEDRARGKPADLPARSLDAPAA